MSSAEVRCWIELLTYDVLGLVFIIARIQQLVSDSWFWMGVIGLAIAAGIIYLDFVEARVIPMMWDEDG